MADLRPLRRASACKSISALPAVRRFGQEAEACEAVADFKLAASDTLLVVGRRENLNRFEKDCGAR